MLTNHAAGDRAARMAIATGTAVNLHIIQATQMAEGFEPCFGRASTDCDQSHCAYHDPCMSLVNFDRSPTIAEAASQFERPRRMPAETLVHPDLERSPRQIPAAGCGFDPVHDAR